MSKVRRLEFLGSWFWLIFWLILFFPVGILYFLFKTIAVEEEIDADKFIEWYRSQQSK